MRSLTIVFGLLLTGFGMTLALRSIAVDVSQVFAQKPDRPESSPAKPAANDAAAADKSPQTPAESAVSPESKDPAVTASEAAKEAQALLKKARSKLIAHHSIQAKIQETVAIGPRKFQVQGTYLQGTDLKLRVDFHVRAGASEASMLEICDGQVLWSRCKVGETEQITRRDVRQILNAAAAQRSQPEIMLKAELGLGGLPALLAAIEDNLDFFAIRQESIGEHELIVIEGRWKPEIRNRWVDESGKPAKNLPAYVPERIRIYFDRDTLFPRRLFYLKQQGQGAAFRPLVTLDIRDVVLNSPIDDEEFQFIPPDGAVPEDVTSRYLKSLSPAEAVATPDQPAADSAADSAP